MALNVTISNGATTYRLKAATVTDTIDRAPIQAPLPGSDPLLLDLGQFRPSIQIEGFIDDVAGSEGGVTIPSKNNLEDAVTDWYNSTITVTIISDAYVCKIKSLIWTLRAFRTTQYEYRLALFTIGRS